MERGRPLAHEARAGAFHLFAGHARRRPRRPAPGGCGPAAPGRSCRYGRASTNQFRASFGSEARAESCVALTRARHSSANVRDLDGRKDFAGVGHLHGQFRPDGGSCASALSMQLVAPVIPPGRPWRCQDPVPMRSPHVAAMAFITGLASRGHPRPRATDFGASRGSWSFQGRRAHQVAREPAGRLPARGPTNRRGTPPRRDASGACPASRHSAVHRLHGPPIR